MDGKEFKLFKELEELKHKFKLIEIETEKKARLECFEFEHSCKIRFEKYKLNAIMSAHRLKRADFKRAREEKRQFGEEKDFVQNYAREISEDEKE